MTMVKRALKRDVGPENRAKEFDPANISQEVWESQSGDGNRPRRVAWSYAWAVVWMLRSIELAAMRLGDAHVEFSKKTVTLLIRKSQNGPESPRSEKDVGLLWTPHVLEAVSVGISHSEFWQTMTATMRTRHCSRTRRESWYPRSK